MNLHARRSIVMIGCVALAAGCAQEAVFVVQFRDLDPIFGPGRIHYCGRDYDKDPRDLSPAQVRREAPYPLTRVMTVPSPVGFAVYAPLTPHALRFAATPALPCTMGLYRKMPWGSYQAFSLSGGP